MRLSAVRFTDYNIHISHLILPRNRWAVTIRPLPSAYCLLLTAYCLLPSAFCFEPSLTVGLLPRSCSLLFPYCLLPCEPSLTVGLPPGYLNNPPAYARGTDKASCLLSAMSGGHFRTIMPRLTFIPISR